MITQVFRVSALAIVVAGAATSAQAADLPNRKAPPIFAASGVNWDGFYLGAHRGYGVGSTKWSNPTGYYGLAPADVPASGYNDGQLIGAQIGYNKQFGALVVGVEGDVSASRFVGYAPCGATVGVGGTGDTCGTRTDMLASLTGRLGYAAGRSLFYVKGGAAYARDRAEITNYLLIPITPAITTKNRFGWTLGGGVAYAIDANWSTFAEYGYYDFGKHAYRFGAPAPAGSMDVAHTQHVMKFGVNYRFGGAGGDVAAPAISNDVTGEFGTRVGYSSGRFKKKLWDNVTPGQLNSALTWPNQAGLAMESFARLDHISGAFVKGTFGGVNLGKGHMNDEDFPPAAIPYSNTRSATKNGRDLYLTADLGYSFLRSRAVNLGAFVGYGFYSQHLNAYGCDQIAGNPGICPPPAPFINPAALVLSETERWHALRLGLAGSTMLTERLKLSGEAVWLAYAKLDAKDNHWLRPNINPLVEKGHGSKSYQLEANLSYAVTDRLNVGLGARYLSLKAEGGVFFPGWATRSPEKFESSRFTTYLQASYRFGDVAPVVAKY